MTEPPVVDLRPSADEPPPDRDYDEFYRRELQPMVALAAAITGSTVAAEDLAQEAMVRAYRSWDKISTYDKPGAWVRRVTVNLALSTRKRAGAELRARLRVSKPPQLQPHHSDHDHVWAAVAQLPGQQRAAVALYYLEDRSVSDIAEVLECSESTARVHLHRGRTTLARLLEGANQ